MVWIKFNNESECSNVKIKELERTADPGEMLMVNENRARVLCEGKNAVHTIFASYATDYDIEKYFALRNGFTGDFDAEYKKKHSTEQKKTSKKKVEVSTDGSKE